MRLHKLLRLALCVEHTFLTCIMFIALCSTCQQLSHRGAHSLRCTSQILSTLLQLCEQQNTHISISIKAVSNNFVI